LKQSLNRNPETGSRTTVQTGTSTNLGTGPWTDPAPSSSESQAIEESKNHSGGSGSVLVSKTEGQGSEQTWGTSAEPCLDKKLQTVQKQAPEIAQK